MQRIAQLFFPWLFGAIAAVCLWDGVDAYLHQLSYGALSAAVALGGAFIFAIAAMSVWRRWRIQRAAAISAGAILLLYAMSVIFLGWEDVGGAFIAIPLAVSTATTGILGFLAIGDRGPRAVA
jgi:hypothetical protein